jgi:hypothetical protein
MSQLEVFCMAIDLLFLKPKIVLSPLQLLRICQILDLQLPLINKEIKHTLSLI